MTVEQIKERIRELHALWYGEDWLNDINKVVKVHACMEDLFNFAEIESTLCENNPDLMSPAEFYNRAADGESVSDVAKDGLKRFDKRGQN